MKNRMSRAHFVHRFRCVKRTLHINLLTLVIVSAGLIACSTVSYERRDDAPARPRNVSNIPDAVPRVEPHSRYGNPDSYVVYGQRYYTLASGRGYRQQGQASWYGTKFHGRHTSSGEVYDMYGMTAAHKTLPLPSYVEVTNLENGRKVILRVNDRGPFHNGRIIDVSYAAAVKLDIIGNGTARVEVRAIDPRPPTTSLEPAQTIGPPPQSIEAPLYLQVGAFQSRYNAERLRRDLEGQNIGAVRIVEAATGTGTFYKVQVGPLNGTREAERVARELMPLGIDAARSYVR
jgi:rare lipoprotein A